MSYASADATPPEPAVPRTLHRLLWLVVAPGLFWYFVSPAGLVLRGLRLDTSEAVVERVRKCRTLAEVEQVIGGPPGNYCWTHHDKYRLQAGWIVPHYVDWSTPRGVVSVVEGYSYCTGSGTTTTSGHVHEVLWRPANEPNPWFTLIVSVAGCFGLPWAFFLLHRSPEEPPAA
jgi:hypothetical protein